MRCVNLQGTVLAIRTKKYAKSVKTYTFFIIFVFRHTYGNKCYFMLGCFNKQFEYVNRIIL